jgi:hypothetical protein
VAVVTISRLYGLAGRVFGLKLARTLGYDYLDKEILARLSDHLVQDEERLALYEETGYGPSRSLVAMLTRKYPGAGDDFPSPSDYGKALHEIVRDVAARDRVIIVGRGSQAILAQTPGTVHLRLVGGEETLLAGLASRRKYRDCTREELLRTLTRQNAARAAFVRTHFDIDPADPLHYDLVINFDRVSREEALEQAAALVRRREAAGTI